MSQKKIIIFEIILCLLVKISIYLISHFVYEDVFDITFIQSLLTSWIVITLIYWKRETNTQKPKFRWFTFLVIGITIALFSIYKPKYTYSEGKDIAAKEGYGNIYELEDKSIIGLKLKGSYFIPDVYLYGGEKDNAKYYILISPISGEIRTDKMGEGNYLDKYFEMKYDE